MKKILIVGAGGFIGFNLSKFFLKKKYKIIGIDNLSREGSANKINFLKSNFRNFNFYKCDITDYKKLKNIISKLNNLKSIIHTAGQVTVTESINDPIQDFKINSMGTLYLLELIKKYHRSSKFIFSSTNKVYGNLNELKILKRKNNYLLRNYHNGVSESLNVDFCSPYGCSKGSADQYVKDFGRIFNMNTVVLRKSCIYGHEQLGIFGQGWISFIMIQAIMGNKITIFGDGYQTRDILYIDDLVELYNKIINKNYKGYEFYNVGGGKQNLLSVKDLILFLKKRNLIKKKIVYAPERLGDQKTYYSNISKVSKQYNWKPKVFKDSGLQKILDYFLNNIDLLEKIYK